MDFDIKSICFLKEAMVKIINNYEVTKEKGNFTAHRLYRKD
jgi:hypothetical protein